MIELAESRDVGLIVVSGGRSSISLGPTADRLSHHAPRDLLIVMNTERGVTLEDGSERLYRRVLIATDGSATADRAARKGYDLAESIGAPVTLVFVGHPATGRLVTEDTAAVYGVGVETDVVMKQGDPSERDRRGRARGRRRSHRRGEQGHAGREALLPQPGAREGARSQRSRRA